MSSTSTLSSPTSTPLQPSLLITLRLSPSLLKQFPHIPSAQPVEQLSIPYPSTPSKATSVAGDEDFKTPLGALSPAGTPASPIPTPSVASPAPTGPGSPSNQEVKAVNGVVEAVKRGGKRAGGGGGKPGPKKRKLDDGSGPIPSRLGPKASLGAINAGLRALDRTGNPCKKWTKSPFAIKSFTGFAFKLKVYESPKEELLQQQQQDAQAQMMLDSPANGLSIPHPHHPLTNGHNHINGLSVPGSLLTASNGGSVNGVSDTASIASGGSGDVGTPREDLSFVGPAMMEGVEATTTVTTSTTPAASVNGDAIGNGAASGSSGEEAERRIEAEGRVAVAV